MFFKKFSGLANDGLAFIIRIYNILIKQFKIFFARSPVVIIA